MPTLTGAQVRDGRMLLGWTQRELAMHSKIEFSAVFIFELYGLVSAEELQSICKTLEAWGIQIVSGRAVNATPPG